MRGRPKNKIDGRKISSEKTNALKAAAGRKSKGPGRFVVVRNADREIALQKRIDDLVKNVLASEAARVPMNAEDVIRHNRTQVFKHTKAHKVG